MRKSISLNRAMTLFLFTISLSFYAQNLIVNADAEQDPITNGWTQLSGNWGSFADITPQNGAFYFGAGIAPDTAELYQDIDVSSLANDIDAGNINLAFSGYIATWNGSDEGRIIVEYRNASNNVLYSYDTGSQSPTEWTKFMNVSVANVNTRVVRVRLLSTRNVGSYSDGYFDNLELYAFADISTSNIYPLYGNVGIGTNTPDSKLAVNGKIHAKEVKVDLENWPDYVFEDSYKLMSLKDIEAYIKEHGHLPNIPKASFVEKNGILLGEMNSKLLEKIEELTLYAIQQEHIITTIENKNLTLEERVEKLEDSFEKLQKVMKKNYRTEEH